MITKKSADKPKKVSPVEVDEAEPITPEVASNDAPDTQKSILAEVSMPSSEPDTVIQTLNSNGQDIVQFVFLREISPAPVIGSYDIGREHNIRGVKPNTTLALPRFVALPLVDAGAGLIR